MVQVTNFLLRWLFLCRLVDDRAEVQTWPYRRPGYYNEHPPHPQQQQQQHQHSHQQQQDQNNLPSHEPQHHHHPPSVPNVIIQDDDNMDIPTYREKVIRSLTSYPPGSSERLQRLEELRLETVRQFAKQLVYADEVIRWGDASSGGHYEKEELLYHHDEDDDDMGEDATEDMCDARFDVDDSIQNEFEQFVQREHALHETSSQHEKHTNMWKRWHLLRGQHDDEDDDNTPIDSTTISSAAPQLHNPLEGLSREQSEHSLASAHQLLTSTRAFLPQLVSTVLHSPPALLPETPTHPDPISSLRSLLIHRCRTTPSLGIELCWLLEAEVGRKWKALFEHRQQTGKRLILIVQADIAAAIATIGAEKASAFNLLQDAEMATAFGVERTRPYDAGFEDRPHGGTDIMGNVHPTSSSAAAGMGGGGDSSPRPPRSTSDLRCRHFGDSMHFVDRLTQISLDLVHVPSVHRQNHLQMRLAELNRRLCRRMATRGRVSIDVEDSSGQQYGHASVPQWSEENVREDMIPHSVHFPMEPQCVCWPGGDSSASKQQPPLRDSAAAPKFDEHSGDRSPINDFEHPPKRNGVVRALRILPNECRVLDSAQRCPFLVRMEVAESGLDADDARLYAGDVEGVGLSIQEALGSVRESLESSTPGHGDGPMMGHGDGFASCEIPPELMGQRRRHNGGVRDDASGDDGASRRENGGRIQVDGLSRYESGVAGGDAASDFSSSSSSSGGIPVAPYDGVGDATTSADVTESNNQAVLSRGGYQGEDEGYYGPPPDMHGSFDMVREQHYEELHHDLRHQRENEFNSPDISVAAAGSNQLSTGSALLDKVFGRPWNTECESIRNQSPYRNVQGWKLASFIIKAGEDIRKEALVMQIMSKLWTWFQEEIPENKRPFLRPYTIMCVGGDAGIVECLPDVKSVNEVKRGVDGFTSLKNFFDRAFGPPIQPPFRPEYQQHQYPGRRQQPQPSTVPNSYGTVSFEKARDNFLRSLVGYSVICYILQIKDRHNANILMDREGHIMHIDFGFVLGETPKMGKVPLFSERAPFKLSAEFWEVIGGWSAFRRFCTMFEAAYAVASAHSDEICSLVEAAVMNVSRDANAARRMAEGVRGRIQMKGDAKEQKMHIMEIVNDAITSWGTSTYDWLQRSMHGYQ